MCEYDDTVYDSISWLPTREASETPRAVQQHRNAVPQLRRIRRCVLLQRSASLHQHTPCSHMSRRLVVEAIRIISSASRELGHWRCSGMAPQYATLCSLRGALLVCRGLGRGPLPGGHVPGERGKEEHSFEAALDCVDLRLLQQLHRVHREGRRLCSAAGLKNRRDQRQGCLLLDWLRAWRAQLEVLQIL